MTNKLDPFDIWSDLDAILSVSEDDLADYLNVKNLKLSSYHWLIETIDYENKKIMIDRWIPFAKCLYDDVIFSGPLPIKIKRKEFLIDSKKFIENSCNDFRLGENDKERKEKAKEIISIIFNKYKMIDGEGSLPLIDWDESLIFWKQYIKEKRNEYKEKTVISFGEFDVGLNDIKWKQ